MFRIRGYRLITMVFNQGPIVLMIENYRTNLIWNLLRQCSYVVGGLRRAGFFGGMARSRRARIETQPSLARHLAVTVPGLEACANRLELGRVDEFDQAKAGGEGDD